MSGVARTNKWLQYGRSLADLEFSCSDNGQLEAIEAAITLTVEKTLVALVYEILELNDVPDSEFSLDHLLSDEDEHISAHWIIKQLEEQRHEPQHWLNQWWLNKKSLSQSKPLSGSVKSNAAAVKDSNLIEVHNQSPAVGWVNECIQLVSDARALNSYD